MTTSGTVAFNPDLNELIEEAYERCGIEVRSGYEHRTARRSLNLMLTEWANRGINLWTIEQGQISLTTANIIYPLPVDTVDLIEQVVRTQSGIPQTDINISRISVDTYATIPNKNAQGRPIQVWINRQTGQYNTTSVTLNGTINSSVTTITVSSTANLPSAGFIKIDSETIAYSAVSGNDLIYCVRGSNNTTAASHTTGAAITLQNLPSINVWPAPDQDNYYTFVYWRLRRMQDAGIGVNVQDIPFRLLNCMVAGLAYYISVKSPETAQRTPMLKQMYDEQLMLALDEDREKAPLRIAPRQLFY